MKSKTKAKPSPRALLGEAYPYHPKVGDVVRFRPWEVIGGKGYPEVPAAFTSAMKPLCGTTARVLKIEKRAGQSGTDIIRLSGDPGSLSWCYSRQMLEPAKISKREAAEWQRAAEKAAADAAADAAAAALKAKAEADAKAAKRAALPAPARAFLAYMDANPDAFGCQRRHVSGVLACVFGVDPAALV